MFNEHASDIKETIVELLFFDTFAHENTEEINLDLVQFPKPVYVTEVRIIPLGARVQADFPGGFRLGATNPSQFQIEFFVNDLSKPGASTFETLGSFEYDQNGKIHLECSPNEAQRKIPTDGLVLRGLYTTITLAVYGILTKNLSEQLIQPIVNPTLPSQTIVTEVKQTIPPTIDDDWIDIPPQPIDYPVAPPNFQSYQPEVYPPTEYPEYYSNDVPKDPRSYHHSEEWDKSSRTRDERSRDYQDRDADRRERRYSRSESSKEHQESGSRSDDRSDYKRDKRHDDSYRRPSYRDEREDRKRPKSPPIQSPKRPRSPQDTKPVCSPPQEVVTEKIQEKKDEPVEPAESNKTVSVDTVAEFEPILSDEDMEYDMDHYQDTDYDYTTYTNIDEIIRKFTPGVTALQKCPNRKRYTIKDNRIEVEENLRNMIGIVDDYLRSSITKYEFSTFETLNIEIKEEFVHLAEKLVGIIDSPEAFLDLTKVYYAVRSMVAQRMDANNQELTNQIASIIETITDWLKIALDYNMAICQEQPAYKIRHMKAGVRLAEMVCHSEEYIEYLWNTSYNMHSELLKMYQQDFMALSIKIMVLKALDTYLKNKFAIKIFIDEGYRVLVEALMRGSIVREKFALSSIMQKLNLYEVLDKLHTILLKLRLVSQDISAEELNLIMKFLNQILSYSQCDPHSFSQPKRFLPVTAQFEIARDNRFLLINHFKMFNLLQCFVLLLTAPTTLNLPPIKTPIFEILKLLLDCEAGMNYLAENSDTVNLLLKCLLKSEEEMQYCGEVKTHQLGLRIAYKLQCLYHVERLNDLTGDDVIDELHSMLCLTFSWAGKFAVGEVLSTGENIKCLLQLMDIKNVKQPTQSYILDLLYFPVVVNNNNVKFLEKYATKIKEFVQAADKANELITYLSQFHKITSNYEEISQYLNKIDDHIETVVQNPGPIISSLRILQKLGISPYDSQALTENPLRTYTELKYKHVILQLYSLDGVSILLKLLQKLCTHYEQPGVHSSIFVVTQGLTVVNIIHPTILLLKKLLSYVVQCRNIQFKDLTAVPVLLKTYNLLNSFPASAGPNWLAQKCKIIVIDTLLVYTQPIAEEESLNKTLWAQTIGEVIKFVTSAPYTFVSGLLILSELLPLPLPLHTADELGKDEIIWTISLRKLWSAHLHPHGALLQEMIGTICTSTQPQLLNLLRRVCVQISDLAAPSALMIVRGFLDNILLNLAKPCSAHLARLLNFLAGLTTHSTIKCAVLHLIHSNTIVSGKSDEKYGSLLTHFGKLLKSGETSNVQAQECALSILQSFCDVELSLLHTAPVEFTKLTSEVYLANALPSKENLLIIVDTILDHLGTKNCFMTYLPILRTLVLLTEHDYGFYHLRDKLLKKDKLFLAMLTEVVEKFSKTNAECLSTLNTLIEFLRMCLTVEDNDGTLLYNPRTIVLTEDEIKSLVGWSESNHPFIVLEERLKTEAVEDKSLETILESLSLILKHLNSSDPAKSCLEAREVVLPTPAALLVQYSCRSVFSSVDACDERLTDRFWLTVPSEEGVDSEIESVSCDLFEICRQLPAEFNLIKEVEKLCRISRTEPPNTDKIVETPDEQRVKSKKPFVTPMRPRGFPRTTPQRPDLFRSRPPNTSRPPSLHVDDFVALETCGAQPTGPTGYNKLSREILASSRMARGPRGRTFVASERNMQYSRQMPWWSSSMGRSLYF